MGIAPSLKEGHDFSLYQSSVAMGVGAAMGVVICCLKRPRERCGCGGYLSLSDLMWVT